MKSRCQSVTCHLAAASLLLGLISAGQAGAEDEPISTLIVTGEFRETELLHLPASLSLITQHGIDARNAQHLDQILALAPNIHYAGGSSRSRYYQIRGIGERSEFARPLNSSVGLIIDGVDFSGIGTVATLHDVEQVEIFRGPQGTRYGANGLAGVINVQTREPTPYFDAGVSARAADYGSRGLGGFVSGPAGEHLGYRLSAEHYSSDGSIRNDFLGRDDTDSADELTLRGRFSWEPRADTALELSLGHVDIDNGFDAFSLDNSRRTLSDEPGHDRQRSNFGSARLSVDVSDTFWVEALASHSDTKVDYGYDEDWVFTGFHPAGYTSFDNYHRDHRRSTAELRALSSEAGRLFGETTDWVAGVYWYDQAVDFVRDYTFFSQPFESRFDVRRYAVFGQTDSRLGSSTTLTLGLRMERHRADYEDNEGVVFNPTDNLYGARVAVDHMLSANTLVYGSVARGYKAGGFNIDGGLDDDLRHFDPEVLFNYELGLKASWRDDALQGRFSAFYMRRHDAQLSTSEQRVREDGTTEFLQYTGNTGRGSDNYGLEAELAWEPLAALSLSGAMGLLQADYGDFVNAQGLDLSGRRQAHAPAYQFHTAAEYRFEAGFFVRAEVEGRDGFYFSDAHDARSDAYQLVHLGLGWRNPHWSLQLWARNVLDKDYPIRGFFFGNDPRTGYTPATFVQLGEPRRVGVSASWRM
jgi:iron complex outermembrane recepter protein